MQITERPLKSGEIIYYVECLLNEGEAASQYLMIECTTKPQAIALAKLMSVTNDVFTEERTNEQPSLD